MTIQDMIIVSLGTNEGDGSTARLTEVGVDPADPDGIYIAMDYFLPSEEDQRAVKRVLPRIQHFTDPDGNVFIKDSDALAMTAPSARHNAVENIVSLKTKVFEYLKAKDEI